MDIFALGIIILRLTAPFLILRMPLTGVALCSFFDFYDFTFLGGSPYYQTIDKTLDLYYLSFCFYVSLHWKDAIARMLSIGLFAYRLIGVMILALTQQEWTLFIFPNVFEMFFLFYLIYIRLSGTTKLFSSWTDTTLVLVVLTFPKLLQEYALHFNWPNPEFPLSVVAFLNNLPDTAYAVVWIGPPIIAMLYHIGRAREQRGHAESLALEPESLPAYVKLAHSTSWGHLKARHK